MDYMHISFDTDASHDLWDISSSSSSSIKHVQQQRPASPRPAGPTHLQQGASDVQELLQLRRSLQLGLLTLSVLVLAEQLQQRGLHRNTGALVAAVLCC